MSTQEGNTKGFSADERAAMQERAKEVMSDKTDGESAILEKIAAMSGSDKVMAEQIHALVKKTAPTLTCRTWYGMPAYANADGKVICYFKNAGKFKMRYSTLGFGETAKLDEGNFWPIEYAITKFTKVEEEKIVALLKKAIQ